MTILVTGASGHLGANLVRALLNQGRAVRTLVHRDRRALQGLELDLYEADINDLNAMRQACQGCRVVFHLAAYISPRMDDWPRLHAINVLGTRNIVQACLDAGVEWSSWELPHSSMPRTGPGSASTSTRSRNSTRTPGC